MNTKAKLAVWCVGLSVIFAPADVRAGVVLESFDTQTFAGPAGAGSFNFTVGTEDNRMLIVGYQHERSAVPARQIDTLTYGGTPLDLAIRQFNPSSQEIAEIWYLIDPPSGSASLSATLNGATESGRGFRLTAIDLSNAVQGPPEATAGSGNQSPNISTSIATLTPNSLLLGFTHNQASNSYTPGAGVTELFDLDAVSIRAALGTKVQTAPGLTSFDWTQSGGGNLDVQAVVAIAAIPEPSTLALAFLGLLGAVCFGRRRER